MNGTPSHHREVIAACALVCLVGIYAVKVAAHWRAPIELGRFKPTHVSSETRARLEALRDEVFITYYVTARARMPSHMRRVERDVTRVLEALEDASRGRLEYQRVDPDTDPELQLYAARRGVAPFRARSVERDAYSERTVWSAVTIAYGQRPESVINGIGPDHVSRLQKLILEHVSQMDTPQRPVVAVSRGEGFSELTAALSARAETVVVDLSQGRAPPEYVDVLFWLHPDGRAAEVRAVDEFLAKGRSVVVAGSERHVAVRETGGELVASFQSAPNDMEAALGHFGLRPLPGLVLDASAEATAAPGNIVAPFFIRSVPYNHDFRGLRGQPNGALLFLAPTAIDLDGPRLEERGWTPEVLVTTSDRTSIAPVPATAFPVRRLTSQGEPAPKLPLAVLLRPRDPWKGLVVAWGATTPFADGFFSAAGAAHGPLLRTLLDNLVSPDRLALHRAGIRKPMPLPELSLAERLAWRGASVLFLPVLLGAAAFVRRNVRSAPADTQTKLRRPRLLWAAVFVALIAAGVRLLAGAPLRLDLSRDALNELAPQTRAIAARMRDGRAVRAEVIFSAPERLPPAMRAVPARLLDMLAELARAGADISIARVRAEDLPAQDLDRLRGLGVERLTITAREEGVTTVHTLYAALRLMSGNRSEVLQFRSPASLESLEFRLAFALRRLETGLRPRIAFAADTPRLTPAEAHEQYQTQQLAAPMGTDAYSLSRELLEEYGFAVTHVNVREPVPPAPDDLLVWIQPRRPLEQLLNVTIRHLHAGGRVLLAAQHFNVQSRQYPGTGFRLVYWPQPQWPEIDQHYFPALGIHLVREVLFDELSAPIVAETQVNRGTRPEIDRQVSTLPFLIRASAAHFARASPVTAGLGDQAFVWGSYIRWDESRLQERGLRATPLITTSDHAWSYAWSGGWIPDDVLAGPTRTEAGARAWLGPQTLAALFEGRFPFDVRHPETGGPFGESSESTDESAATVDADTNHPPLAAQREGKLLLIGGSELFKNHRLRTAEFRADHLLLNAVAALALDDELAAIASRRSVGRGFGRLEPSSRLLWHVVVITVAPALLVGAGVVRGLRSRHRARPTTRG